MDTTQGVLMLNLANFSMLIGRNGASRQNKPRKPWQPNPQAALAQVFIIQQDGRDTE